MLHKPDNLAELTGNKLSDATRLRFKNAVEEAQRKKQEELARTQSFKAASAKPDTAAGKKKSSLKSRLGFGLLGRQRAAG